MNNKSMHSKFKSKLNEYYDKVKTQNSSNFLNILLNIILFIISIIVLFIIFQIIYYIFYPCHHKKVFADYIFDFSLNPCKFTSGAVMPYIERKLLDEQEVYHIGNQVYTYKEADCKCRSYNGRLASKNEITDAFNNGANWCSYGWSAGHSAYYPTQKREWDRLRKQGRERDCGHVGINGGYFRNGNIRFGVNCYGIKPKGKVVRPNPVKCTKKDYCHSNYPHLHPDKEKDKIAPFNPNKWSMYN